MCQRKGLPRSKSKSLQASEHSSGCLGACGVSVSVDKHSLINQNPDVCFRVSSVNLAVVDEYKFRV